VREAILFGSAYDEGWYQTTIGAKAEPCLRVALAQEDRSTRAAACALDDDIRLWPHGDRTEVGERGVRDVRMAFSRPGLTD
jgi:hypothetical protein